MKKKLTQEKSPQAPLWRKIIQACLWLLPVILIGVMVLLKQSGNNYKAIGYCGYAMVLVGFYLRLMSKTSAPGCHLVYGGIAVRLTTSLLLGGKQTTDPVPLDPLQTVSFSEWLRTVVLSFATVEQVHRVGVILAVIIGLLILYFVGNLIWNIKQEDLWGTQVAIQNIVLLSLPLAFGIYVLCIM